MLTISACKAINRSEALYTIMTAWLGFIFYITMFTTINKKIIMKTLMWLGFVLSIVGMYQIYKAPTGQITTVK